MWRHLSAVLLFVPLIVTETGAPREPVTIAGISRGFHILPLVLALLLIAGTFVAWRRTGASRVRATVVVTGMTIALLVWMGGTYVLAASGLLRFDTRPPTFMLLVVALVIVSVGVGVSRVGRRLAAGLPLWILVGSQAFRLPLELLMHEAYEAGLMPGHRRRPSGSHRACRAAHGPRVESSRRDPAVQHRHGRAALDTDAAARLPQSSAEHLGGVGSLRVAAVRHGGVRDRGAHRGLPASSRGGRPVKRVDWPLLVP
jgi:hypothetical protein